MGKHYDFIIIGGGSAGYAAASTVREYREKVAIVDGSKELGGLCILRGCMPSKTLLFIADILHYSRRGELFGLNIPYAEADMEAINKRKKRLIKEFAEYRVQQLESDKFTLLRSHGRFLNDHTIVLDNGEQLTADGFIVATGSKINTPQIPGLDCVPFLTSDEILDLDTIPESVIILGGGIVAAELAQFLNRMGSSVTQIQRSSRILKDASPESSDVVMQAFRDEGIELFTETEIRSIEVKGTGVSVQFLHNGSELIKQGVVLFNALGRIPNTSNLNLESAGVNIQESGHISTNSFQQTSNPIVYAAGDCCGPHEIVHTAIFQGEVAGRHFLGKNPKPVNYDHLTMVIFTDPQVATVGIPLDQIKRNSANYICAEYPFNDHGKSILMEAKYGYVKIWALENGQILGAECVGRDAGELIHSLAIAVTLKANVSDLLNTHWYHPTLSEIWTYPLEEIASKIKSI
ncbi:MAG: Mercuric reductase [Candidatus Moanabacter tarae]|uniref:Mercuric reductase n=1 Tax=Candidatus Moanibacter tarae TaxID=2200854 RepID=A0A2Z4ADY1_9BACT|nr:MAG: Mercuric reductase [Candidatus Moanabacter tarae]|tara:strand:+ start:6883 stop:8268 length:1386 start_codon:yes stop_codon:yes gene_type:complete